MTLLLLAMLFSTAFTDRAHCTIQGYVSRFNEVDNVTFDRADSCVEVRAKADGNAITMYSPAIWVTVIIPPEHGHRRFMYRWGSEFAHIGPDTVPIAAGYVEQG